MLCPICDGETRITNSRPDYDYVRRRRECTECGYRFTTLEIDKDLYERIIKENDDRRKKSEDKRNL